MIYHPSNHLPSLSPLHLSRVEADGVTEQLFTRAYAFVSAEAKSLGHGYTNHLVQSGIVPAAELQPWLGQEPLLARNCVAIFLSDELAAFAQTLAEQEYGITEAWDLYLRGCTAYHTWDLPGLCLETPEFETWLRSALWIPLGSMSSAYGSIMHGDAPQLLCIAFVTRTDVWVSRQWIDYDHLVGLQIADSSANSKRCGRFFTEQQVETAEREAKTVGALPWLAGVWPVYFDKEDENVFASRNVVGSVCVDVSEQVLGAS